MSSQELNPPFNHPPYDCKVTFTDQDRQYEVYIKTTGIAQVFTKHLNETNADASPIYTHIKTARIISF